MVIIIGLVEMIVDRIGRWVSIAEVGCVVGDMKVN